MAELHLRTELRDMNLVPVGVVVLTDAQVAGLGVERVSPTGR